MSIRAAHVVPCTEAEGPGRRFAIWFQGCPLRCPGCCNPEMLRFEGGIEIKIVDLLAQIDSAVERDGVEGITLLGGEPFAHAAAAASVAEAVKQRGLTVMIFSGYTLSELRGRKDAVTERLLSNTDILVDGPYLRDLPETQRRWIGSKNQIVHFLSDRYSENDPVWLQPNTLELRLDLTGLTVNGFPAAESKSFWQRTPTKPSPK